MSKKCTLLWYEAHFQVKMDKTHQVRNTFNYRFLKLRCRKIHAVVARSTFGGQNVQNTPTSDHFWKLWCRKSARRCGAKQISKSKCTNHTCLGPLLEVEMSKKCTPLWREAHFQVKMYHLSFGKLSCRKSARCCGEKHISKSSAKNWGVRSTFGRSDVVWPGRRKGLGTLSKVSKTWRFCSMSKNMAGVGHLKRIWQDAFSVAGVVQETCSSEMLGGPGADFLRGLHFGASDLQFWEDRFAWRLQHFVWSGINFSWQAQQFRQVEWKNRKTHWYKAVSSALSFPFLKEVSQNCFVFDVVNFENWGSLAELSRFWCCQVQQLNKSRQVQKLRTSRRIAAFSSWQVGRQTDRDKQIDRSIDR